MSKDRGRRGRRGGAEETKQARELANLWRMMAVRRRSEDLADVVKHLHLMIKQFQIKTKILHWPGKKSADMSSHHVISMISLHKGRYCSVFSMLSIRHFPQHLYTLFISFTWAEVIISIIWSIRLPQVSIQ